MKPLMPDPERWSDRGDGAAAEDLMGAALRRVRAATAPGDELIARLGKGLATTPARRVRRPGLVLAFAAIALVAAGGTVGARSATFRAWATRRGLLPPPARTPAAGVAARRVVHVAPALAPAAAPPLLEPSALEAPPAGVDRLLAPVAPARGVARASAPASRVATEPGAAWSPPLEPAVSDPSRDEAELLARAFRALRAETDPTKALRLLAESERRFPAGRLRAEARLARAEALLALGRAAEALPVLESLGDGLPREVQLARAELLADGGRCDAAVHDFSAVLARSNADALGARALRGRVACRNVLPPADMRKPEETP